jgi:hypothetical protein
MIENYNSYVLELEELAIVDDEFVKQGILVDQRGIYSFALLGSDGLRFKIEGACVPFHQGCGVWGGRSLESHGNMADVGSHSHANRALRDFLNGIGGKR